MDTTWMKSQIVGILVRILTVGVGAWLVSKGLTAEASKEWIQAVAEAGGGLILVIGVGLWSYFSRKALALAEPPTKTKVAK
jgi:hypothetical protein